jgi:SNF2 family DNA or RNA helicase
MGLGKTPQASVALKAVLKHRALVICPAALRVNWQRELKIWFPEATTGIADGKRWPMAHDIVILSYNALARWKLKLRTINWNVVVCDEAHYMKTLDSQRTVNVRGGFGTSPIPCDIKWALTGTPMLNRPIEVYPILKWLEADFAKSEAAFGLRYCGGYEKEFRGATNIPELREKLKGIMLRRLKKDVLADLPPKTRQVIEMELGPEGRAAIAAEKNALREAGMSFEDVIRKLDAGMTPRDKGIIARLRKLVGLLKIDACAEHLIELLDSGVLKLIVFAHHREVVERVNQHLRDYLAPLGKYTGMVYGDTPKGGRQPAVDNFQQDPNCAVIIGNITAMGVGYTLTAASLVVFIERAWTPGENTQAEDRAHRYGQTRGVLIQHLVLNNSLDSYMARSVIAKQAILDAIMN